MRTSCALLKESGVYFAGHWLDHLFLMSTPLNGNNIESDHMAGYVGRPICAFLYLHIRAAPCICPKEACLTKHTLDHSANQPSMTLAVFVMYMQPQDRKVR